MAGTDQPAPDQRIDVLALIRITLALCVVATHFGGVPEIGRHAVVGFYCISGFLITRMATSKYRSRPGAFLKNRFLRIYPQYWAAALLGLAAAWLLPQECQRINAVLHVPERLWEWPRQFLIFGLYASDVRLSPPTWSLNVEMYYYLVIGLVSSRSERWTYVLLAVSSALGALCLFQLLPGYGFYGGPVGNAFVFFLGSAAHFQSRRIRVGRSWPVYAGTLAFGLCWFVLVRWNLIPHHGDGYLALTALGLFLVLLDLPRVGTPSVRLSRAVQFSGRLTYPLFLVHHVSAVLVIWAAGGLPPHFFPWVVAVSLALSTLFVLAIDRPIERIRATIREARPA